MTAQDTILVANRGEIAARVFRSARALGLKTAAVYSDADAGGLHVEAADDARHIGPASARESYLDADRLLEAAQAAHATAIHPGYGFLSESAEFAEAVIGRGLTWIGPAPDIIRTMGDKQRARALAEGAGVPVVPGSGRFAVGETEGLAQAGERIGYPLLVKASAGGGGIGMRRVDDPAKLTETVEATQSMAQKAFGDGSVFLERFVPKARHVEIQVFGFGDGRAIHLFERDCSLQRRYQKVIEESPAPRLPEPVRQRMEQAAVALCEHVSYAGAGTVEFIVDAESHDFFFLEMNTRIQVEHPVTEMVTGRDLVAMQIELALGRLEAPDQVAIETHGHAIECRLYAERPEKMFMPSPGTLTRFEVPQPDDNVRVDNGYRAGDTLTPFYDPMIAKIIVRDSDREAARQRMIKILEGTHIEGIGNNRAFLLACFKDTAFAAGDVYTGFIEEKTASLLSAA